MEELRSATNTVFERKAVVQASTREQESCHDSRWRRQDGTAAKEAGDRHGRSDNFDWWVKTDKARGVVLRNATTAEAKAAAGDGMPERDMESGCRDADETCSLEKPVRCLLEVGVEIGLPGTGDVI